MKRAAWVICLTLMGGPLWSAPVDLTPEQLRAFGSEALLRGYAEQALGVAEALLRRDPSDALALVLKAQALRMLGDLAASEAAARAAWAVARTEAERYAAASALAQALSLQDHRTRAQYWLRQAVQHAPNAGTKAQAIDDFAYVRDQNPVKLQFSASTRPSNNVNGGARDPLFEVFGIPFVLSGDALALSGITYGFGLTGQRRLSDDGLSETDLTFGASKQGVVLSQAARDQAPGARNGDYAMESLQLGVAREWRGRQGKHTAAITASHAWYGGTDLSDSLRLDLGLERTLASGITASLDASLAWQERLDNAAASSRDSGIEAGVSVLGPGGDRWQAGLGVKRVASQDSGIDHDEVELTLGWQAARPVAGLGLGASLSGRLADYDASPFTLDGRHDRRLGLSVSATFQNLSYLGYSPVLTLDMARNDSNVTRYETETVGLSVSFRSRF